MHLPVGLKWGRTQERAALNLRAAIFTDEAQDAAVDPADGHKDNEHGHIAHKAIHNIRKFHIAGVGDFLANLDGKGDDYHHGGYIDPGDGHNLVLLCEILEQGIDYKNHTQAQQSKNQEMQVFVGKIHFISVVQTCNVVVNSGHLTDAPDQNLLHGCSSFWGNW